MKKLKYHQGSLLVEAVITTSFFLASVLAVLGVSSAIIRSSLGNVSKIQASYLEVEGLEAMRVIRDSGWEDTFSDPGMSDPFYLEFNGVTWVATTSNSLIGGVFQRQIVITNVSRGANQNILSPDDNSGVLDLDTKKVDSTVSWFNGNATTTRSISTYFTNVFNN